MDWLLISVLSVILILLILSFLFSGAEIGLTSISRSRVNKLKLDGNKKAKIIDNLLNKKELTIGTILLGNTVINIACSALFTAIFINFFGNDGIFISTIIMTFCILLFCEVLPKTYAIQNPEKFSSFSAYFILFFVKVFSPLTLAVQFIVNLILKLFRLHKNREVISAADAMRNMISLHRTEGTMLPQDLDMLSSILDLAETEISEIMIHRKNLFSLDISQNSEDLIKNILTSRHSRIPLWQEEPEKIIGVVHVKDLINALREKNNKIEEVDITKVMSEPCFLPESTPLSVQLHNFRKNRKHLAFVIDEYGALQGIVTLEDILEEIVGEISDEHDAITENFVKEVSDNVYHIEGESTIRDVNRQLHWNLPNEEATTLAGMIVNEIERIPDEGEEFFLYGFNFKILKKDKNAITIVEVQVKSDNTVTSD
ncbi:HlyC/CorC family transporter [Wolbachia endosymbiont of Ctenocephalides felis wCfeT]|uniref:HlyC/CorC family transporter n=1 Tax=Wolbachia endosymbiont of Ctenocephalides felis wCfeT TaxID=2732593 RepID=UPI001447972A|nr:CNNM domain-containing protein [Wolbachia endosymbiont of Ctenocephalides felis wCfeT]